MKRKIVSAVSAFIMLVCSIPAFANIEMMNTITFDAWTNAYSEPNFRVIYGNSSNPSVFSSAFANRKVFGGTTRSFFYGNEQGSTAQYGSGYGKIYNFADSAFGSGYEYKYLSFDIALQSVNTQMYVYNSLSPGTILFEISGGKILSQKKTALESIEAERWYNIKMVEKSDGTWKTYIDNKCMLEQKESVVSSFGELRFVLRENTDTYKTESGAVLYNAYGFYLDNIGLQTLGSEPVIDNNELSLTSGIADVKNDFPRRIAASRSVTAGELLSSLNIADAVILDSDSEPAASESSAAGCYLCVKSNGNEIIYPIKSGENSRREYETTVFANETFDSGTENITAVSKNGIIETVLHDGEGYLRVKKESASDMYFEVNNIAALDKKLICEFTVVNKAAGISGNLFMLRDSITGTGKTEFYMSIENGRLYAGKQALCSFNDGEERHIVLSFDLTNHTWNAMVDGNVVCSGMSMSESLKCITTVRFYFANGSGEMYFDNLKLYNADEICSIDDIAPIAASPFKNPAYGKIALNGNIAVDTEVSSVWDGNEKYYTENPVVLRGGEYYMNAAEAAELFNTSPDSVITVNSSEYAAIKAVSQKAGLLCSDNGKGLLIFSEEALSCGDNAINEAYKYMAFRRCSPQTLIQKSKKTHPYILGASNERFAEISSLIGENEFITERFNKIKASADNIINAPALRYNKVGSRLYAVAAEFKKRATELALIYKLTGDNKYKTRLESEINAVCSFDDWNADAHYIDAAETAFGMAVCIDWLNDDLSENTLSLAKEKLNEYFLDYSLLGYEGKFSAFWITSNINWNAVCNGASAVAAMAVFEDNPQKYAGIISKALRGYESCITEFAPSGSWHEGPHYWEYTTEYLSYLHSSMEGFFGSDLDFGKIRGLAETAYYQIAMDSPQGMNSYHDGFSDHVNSAALFYLGKRYNDLKITSAKLYFDDLYNTLPEASELIWLDTAAASKECDIAPDMYFAKDEAAALRERWQKEDSTYISFHGGNNTAAHAHDDGGAFVLDMLGERWFLDIPIENYDTTGESASFRKSRKGHNTVEIIPAGETYGAQNRAADAVITRFESGAQSSFAVMDMTKLYNCVSSFNRGIMLSEEKKTAHIRDEITLTEPSDIIWRAATDADVTVNGNTAILEKNGKSVVLTVYGENAALSLNDRLPLSSYRNPGNKIKQLEIALSASADAYIDVCVSENSGTPSLPLRQWSVNESKASFTDSYGTEIYKMPEDGVTVHNNSEAMQLAACYENGILINAAEIPAGGSRHINKCGCIKVLAWDKALSPAANYKILK